MLGIGQDASAGRLRAAYARLVRTFHPDALRGPGLGDVEPQREAVCLRAGEAYEVLRNDEARAAFDNNLKLWRRRCRPLRLRRPHPFRLAASAGLPSAPAPPCSGERARRAGAPAEAGLLGRTGA